MQALRLTMLAAVLVCGCRAHDLPVGASCSVGECAAGEICVAVALDAHGETVGGCARTCEDGHCDGNTTCWFSGYDTVLACFPAGTAGFGDACTYQTDCGRGLTCLQPSTGAPGTCASACFAIDGCETGSPCEGGDCRVGVCGTVREGPHGPESECLAPCDVTPAPGRPGLCADGSLCSTAAGGTIPVCWPGESAPLGGPCSPIAQCVRGATCVAPDATGNGTCVHACNVDADCTGTHCNQGLCL